MLDFNLNVHPVLNILKIPSFSNSLMVAMKSMCDLFSVVGPSITVPPQDQTVVAPASVSFTCIAEGLLIPNITWFTFTESQGLTELDTQDSNISTLTNGRQLISVLTLSTVEPFMTTAITYLCNATNIVSQDRAMATLTVHGE